MPNISSCGMASMSPRSSVGGKYWPPSNTSSFAVFGITTCGVPGENESHAGADAEELACWTAEESGMTKPPEEGALKSLTGALGGFGTDAPGFRKPSGSPHLPVRALPGICVRSRLGTPGPRGGPGGWPGPNPPTIVRVRGILKIIRVIFPHLLPSRRSPSNRHNKSNKWQ